MKVIIQPALWALLLFTLPQARLWAGSHEQTLSTVVVTGTRTEKTQEDAPVRTEVVGKDELQRTNARTLRDALENVPGVQLREIQGKSGYEISLQGLSSDQVLVLVDGLPVAASTGSTVDVSQYLLGEVERVEVVKGASSAQYGSSAMGGVVNVITQGIRPGLAGEATVDVGSYGKQNDSGKSADIATRHVKARIEGGSEDVQARLVADRVDSDGFGANPSAWTREGDAIRREQLGGRLAWQPTAQTEFWLDGNLYRERDTQRYEYYAPPNYIPQRKTEEIDRTRLAAGSVWRFDSKASVRLSGLDEQYQSSSQGYSNGYLSTDRHSRQQIRHLSLQTDLPAWRGQLWQLGADLHHETLTQSVNGVSELNGDAKRSSRELFVQNDVLAIDNWELLLGLRWQNDSDFGGKLAPKIALAHTMKGGEGWSGTLRASFGQGYRVPNLKERHYRFDHSALGYVVIGNPDLRPESSNSFQLGSDFRLGRNLALEFNLFHNRVRELIQIDEDKAQTVNGIAQYSYENISRATTSGLETGARWQASPQLAFSGAYTFTKTEDRDSGTELTRRPRHIARLGADWQFAPADQLSLRSRYQSSELVSSGSTARSPAWQTFDLTWNHRVDKSFTAFAGVNNLFDRQRNFDDANDYSPLAGRYLFVGLRYAFAASR